MANTLTDEQYIKASGLQCPTCQRYEVTSVGHVETDNGSAWQEVSCDYCKATWKDIYQLTGYDNLKVGSVIYVNEKR